MHRAVQIIEIGLHHPGRGERFAQGGGGMSLIFHYAQALPFRFTSQIAGRSQRLCCFHCTTDWRVGKMPLLVNIALDDAYHLGMLSSRIHVYWALAMLGQVRASGDNAH